MLFYDTVERCIVCGNDLEVWYYTRGKIILWCSHCKAVEVFKSEHASPFGNLQPQLPLFGRDLGDENHAI